MTAPRNVHRLVCLGIVAFLVAGSAGDALADYVTEVMADNPAGYWRFEEANFGDPALDSSVNSNHGTYTGDILLGQAGTGSTGNSAQFNVNALTGFVDLPGTWGGGSAVTVEAWVNTADPITGNFQAVVAGHDPDGFTHFQLHTAGGTGVYTNTGFKDVFPPSTSPTGQWRHLVFVAESGNTRVYENGFQLGATNTSPFSTITASSTVDIGVGYQGGRHFKGLMDEVAIYNSALPEERIQAHFVAGGGVLPDPDPPAALVAHWTFDDGKDAMDETGNHNGVMGGGAQITPHAVVGSGALDLRGIPGSVNIPTTVLNAETDASIAFWVSAESLAGCCNAVFMSDGGWGTGKVHTGIATADGRTEFLVNGGTHTKTASNILGNRAWNHVAFTYNSATGVTTPYFNGVSETPLTSTIGQTVSVGSSTIGAWDTNGPVLGGLDRFLDGRIDDMRVYTGILTPEEVAALAVIPESDGPVAHWTFDQEQGAADSSHRGNHGTLETGAVITAPNTNSAIVGDGALDLRGVNGHVDIPTAVLSDASAVTVAYWVSLDSFTADPVANWGAAIFANDGWGGSQVHVNVPYLTGIPELAVCCAPPWTTADGPIAPDGSWVHVALTYDSETGTGTAYVNGDPQGSTAGPAGKLVGTGPATIGAYNGNSRYVDGRIDDLRIYNRVLSQGEIEGLAALPEPSTLILLGVGLAGLIGCARRRNRS